MLSKFMKPLAALVVTAALAIPMVMSTATATPAQEKHPVLREAMRKIEGAKGDLQKYGARDLDGHRAKAVEHLDQALGELKRALESDPN